MQAIAEASVETVDSSLGSSHAPDKSKALSLLSSHRPRNVGWVKAAALLFGDWGTSRLYVLGLAFAFTGRASFWLICAMSILVAAVGWAYTQICRIYPDGGGVYAAARQRSQILAVVGALLLFADYTITASLSALDAFHYFGMHATGSLLDPMSAGLWAIIGIIVVGAFNLMGPKHTAGFAIVAAVGMILTTLVVTLGALPRLSGSQIAHGALAPVDESAGMVWVHFVSIVLALSGVEAIANLTGVLKKPVSKTAAKSIWVVTAEVAIFNVLLALVMSSTASAVGDDVLREHKEDMLAFLSFHYVGVWAEWCVRILGGLLLLSAANTAIGGLIAVVYLLSRDSELPRPLQSLNRFGVPWIPALIALGVPVLVLVVSHDLEHLAALYAIGVVGAVAINVSLCAFHPRLRKSYRKGPMAVLGLLLLAIWITLAFTKLHALAFVAIVMVVGLTLRFITRRFAKGGQELSVLRQAIVEQLPDNIITTPKFLIGTYGSTALADQAVTYCQQHNRALVVNFIRELSLNEQVYTEQGRLAIDTDPVAVKTFAHYLELGHQRGVPIVPAYDTGTDAALLMAETAALYGCEQVLIGTSRHGPLYHLVKGRFQSRLEQLLPKSVSVEVMAAARN